MNPLNNGRFSRGYDAKIPAVAFAPVTVRFPPEKSVKASTEIETVN